MDNERVLHSMPDDEAESSFNRDLRMHTEASDNKSFLDAVADQKSDARPIAGISAGRSAQLDLGNLFSYHPPKDGQRERYEAIRAKGLEMAELIQVSTPSSAEQTLAIRKIQEAVMFANASIACNE